ncbi:AP-4 complex accessory subunit tepsin isoform X2 [Entelurus aequoreus]|uniref:AP-4 complex accessory subunit tepsin isoform X2 n=1 Tax=Entelurus aequoreus TaxID=161455 RepID=UPI002B1D6A5E|nr:AP-4 complex accessory subunit tepsin isoform X2 [Entelurus aequoreus]
MATFMERFAFLQKVPTLMKATADDESPCPGYLFQEIGSILWHFVGHCNYSTGNVHALHRFLNTFAEISHESSANDQCLLEYLLERLQVESCHVKLKVLKILVHLCGHGSKHFLTELRRNSTFIQQASVYSGPPDPIHGLALYQKVRKTAQEVARLLFSDTISIKSGVFPLNISTPTMGMGSAATHRSAMQGFGYNPAGTDSLLDKIQKAAEVVASAVLPPIEHQGIRLHDNHYRAVVAPSAPIEVAVPACAYSLSARKPKGGTKRCPGQVGGGWEEIDSGNTSSHHSSQDISTCSRASGGSKSACTDSQSGASRESSGDLSERVEALQLGDCGQEMALIGKLTEGSRVFLSTEESQHFVKKCSTLNCEVVVELLSSQLQDSTNTIKMRALCAVSCLMTTDLLSLEQIFGATQRRLCQLSEGPAGPAANKATKILRQFKALMGGAHNAAKLDPANSSHTSHNHVPHPPSSFNVNSVSSQEFINNKEKLLPTEQQLALDPVRTAKMEAAEEESAPCMESLSVQQCVSKLSLFTGMNLVTRGRPPYETTISHIDIDSVEDNQPVHKCKGPDTVVSDGSQQASAFLFLNS